MKIILKTISVILFVSFWFFSTYFYGVGAALRLEAERSQNVELFKKLLIGLYPLKTEARSALLEKVISALLVSPDLINNQAIVGVVVFALDQGEKEMRASPNNLFVSTQLAQLYTMLGQKEGAVFYMNRTYLLSPKRQTTLWLMFNLLNILGEKEEAEKALHYLESISPAYLDKIIR